MLKNKNIEDYRWFPENINYNDNEEDSNIEFEPFKYISCDFIKVKKGHSKILNSEPLFISKPLDNKTQNLDDVVAIYWYIDNKLYRLSNYWGTVYSENSIFRLYNNEPDRISKTLEKEKIFNIPELGVIEFDSKNNFLQLFEKININKLKFAKQKNISLKDSSEIFVFGQNILQLDDHDNDNIPKNSVVTIYDSLNIKSYYSLHERNNKIERFETNFKVTYNDQNITLAQFTKFKRSLKYIACAADYFYLGIPIEYTEYFKFINDYIKYEVYIENFLNKKELGYYFENKNEPTIHFVNTPNYINESKRLIFFDLNDNTLDYFKENIFNDIKYTLKRNKNYKDYDIFLISNPTKQNFSAFKIDINNEVVSEKKTSLKDILNLYKIPKYEFNNAYPAIQLSNYTKSK